MSSSNCCFLICIQISQEADQVVWYSHLLKNLPQFIVIHTVKGSGIVNKAEIDVFLELSCFFHDPADVGRCLISGSSAFSKTSFNIRKFTVHILLKLGLENFEHYFTSLWDECNCAVVWAFFGIGGGNGNPLQCSCLENPMDRGAWWAAVYGVAQRRTQLKQLSSSITESSKFLLHLLCHQMASMVWPGFLFRILWTWNQSIIWTEIFAWGL